MKEAPRDRDVLADETAALSPGEMMEKEEYIRRRRIYESSRICNMSHNIRLILHPILLIAISVMNKLNGFKYTMLFNSKVPTTDKPIIFSITHIGKHDIEICSQALKKHYYLLSGDFENLHGTFEGTFLELNGIIYLNKYDKEDKIRSKDASVEILKKGGNIMWFPEGIWNLSPNQPVLPLPFGIIEVALRANAAIVPVAIEQYGKNFLIHIGDIFDVEKYAEQYSEDIKVKLHAISDLRDIMASLKYKIWEYMGAIDRSTIPEDYFGKFVEERLSEWHGFTYADVRAREFCPKNITAPETVFAPLERLLPKRENAFLFRKSQHGEI